MSILRVKSNWFFFSLFLFFLKIFFEVEKTREVPLSPEYVYHCVVSLNKKNFKFELKPKSGELMLSFLETVHFENVTKNDTLFIELYSTG